MLTHCDPPLHIVRNVFVSTKHRDTVRFPSPAQFTLDMPIVIHKVFGVMVLNYKFVAERLINNNNNEFAFTANGGSLFGTLSIDKGDYNQSISDLLAEINEQLNAYDVQFTLEPVTQRVQLTFTGTFVTDYFAIDKCKLLDLLGFENGICLYRAGSAPSPLPFATIGYETVAVATNPYRVVANTDMILRITDVEAVLSSDRTSNRATAVLVSTRNSEKVTERMPKLGYFPLLQEQHRLQQLRVEILNSDGDPYDIDDEGASFMIEFHCRPDV